MKTDEQALRMLRVAIVKCVKLCVVHDIMLSIVPPTIKTFGELHDYVDANAYGGFCDDTFDKELDLFFGIEDEIELSNKKADLLNAVQDEVNAWIMEGLNNANA